MNKFASNLVAPLLEMLAKETKLYANDCIQARRGDLKAANILGEAWLGNTREINGIKNVFVNQVELDPEEMLLNQLCADFDFGKEEYGFIEMGGEDIWEEAKFGMYELPKRNLEKLNSLVFCEHNLDKRVRFGDATGSREHVCYKSGKGGGPEDIFLEIDGFSNSVLPSILYLILATSSIILCLLPRFSIGEIPGVFHPLPSLFAAFTFFISLAAMGSLLSLDVIPNWPKFTRSCAYVAIFSMVIALALFLISSLLWAI